jgi:hypothetical protein
VPRPSVRDWQAFAKLFGTILWKAGARIYERVSIARSNQEGPIAIAVCLSLPLSLSGEQIDVATRPLLEREDRLRISTSTHVRPPGRRLACDYREKTSQSSYELPGLYASRECQERGFSGVCSPARSRQDCRFPRTVDPQPIPPVRQAVFAPASWGLRRAFSWQCAQPSSRLWPARPPRKWGALQFQKFCSYGQCLCDSFCWQCTGYLSS